MAIALIELEENELAKLSVPFSLYGVYNKNASAKLKAAFLMMGELRKQMGEQHKIIEALQEYSDDE